MLDEAITPRNAPSEASSDLPSERDNTGSSCARFIGCESRTRGSMDVIEISRRAVGKVDVVVHARCACNFERTTAMGNNQGNQTEHRFQVASA